MKPEFHTQAVSAFERTYRSLFQQAQVEVTRLDRINNAMHVLEETLLDPDRVRELEPGQQIALADLLSRTSNNTIKNLMGFGQLFLNIKTVVGLFDGVSRFTAIEAPVGQFPGLPNPEDSEGDDSDSEDFSF